MRRVFGALLVAGSLVAVSAVPAGAQDIADLPRLGYEITPDRGHVGDDVHSQVNPDDLREHCWSQGNIDPSGTVADSLGSFETEFMMTFKPGEALGLFGLFAGDPWWDEFATQVVAKYGWWDPEDNPGLAALNAVAGGPMPEGIPDDQDGQNFVSWVRNAVDFATSMWGISTLTAAIYPELHVTTFVDPVTQEMLGEMGNFDPVTGEGTMLVPELDPALYAVVAACAFLVPEDQYMEALTAGFVAAWEWSVENDFFPTGGAAFGWGEWAQAGGLAAFFGELMEPHAVGIDFYCVLQPDGFCATPPGPVGLIDDDVLDEFNGDEPGDDLPAPDPSAEDLDDPADTGELVAVQATPSFTG